MKTILFSVLFLAFMACEKEETAPIFTLNGTYMGKAVGYAQPFNFDIKTTWVVSHVGDEFKASLTHEGQGFNVPKYEGVVKGDSIIVGFLSPAGYNPVTQLQTKGKVYLSGDSLTFESDASIPYVRVKYYLKRQK